MRPRLLSRLVDRLPIPVIQAHCDGPCGVYDPAAARIAAEAVLSMTRKLLSLEAPPPDDATATCAYLNTVARYVTIKEEQAEIAKRELLILWTDYFKPDHLERVPDLHDLFWRAAKLCSACKVEASNAHAEDLLRIVEEVHDAFWKTQGRKVAWYTAT
jgi:nickel superoxide dismutase